MLGTMGPSRGGQFYARVSKGFAREYETLKHLEDEKVSNYQVHLGPGRAEEPQARAVGRVLPLCTGIQKHPFKITSTSTSLILRFFFFFFFFCLFFAFSWAAPTAHGGSQARGPIGAVATSLRQSHSNTGSEPRLQPTPQLTATPDRQPTEQEPGPHVS